MDEITRPNRARSQTHSRMVALSEEHDLLARLFDYRFRTESSLKGHSFGNLFVAALTDTATGAAVSVPSLGVTLARVGSVVPSPSCPVESLPQHCTVGLPAGTARIAHVVLPPATAVLPVGGIDASNLAAWRAAGAAGFGIGLAIYRAGDSPETVAVKARGLVSALGR